MTALLGVPLEPDPAVFEHLARGVWDRRRWSNGGPLVERLERLLEARSGWPHARAVSSGTAALTVALQALQLPRGGEVVTSPLTFRATALAIEAAGLRPVFAAADETTLCLRPDAVSAAITADTVAILPVHLFGLPADRALDEIADARGVPVVYDGAHCFGFSEIAGRGAATAYSLHATKILHTGEGGFVATESGRLAERIEETRNFGIVPHTGSGPRHGMNAKLPELSAAVGLAQDERLDAELSARRRLRAAYSERIAASPRVRVHAEAQQRALVMEPLRCDAEDRDEILDRLRARDILARGFPALTDEGEPYSTAPLVGATRSETSALARTALALPFHGRVTADQLDRFEAAIS